MFFSKGNKWKPRSYYITKQRVFSAPKKIKCYNCTIWHFDCFHYHNNEPVCCRCWRCGGVVVGFQTNFDLLFGSNKRHHTTTLHHKRKCNFYVVSCHSPNMKPCLCFAFCTKGSQIVFRYFHLFQFFFKFFYFDCIKSMGWNIFYNSILFSNFEKKQFQSIGMHLSI